MWQHKKAPEEWNRCKRYNFLDGILILTQFWFWRIVRLSKQIIFTKWYHWNKRRSEKICYKISLIVVLDRETMFTPKCWFFFVYHSLVIIGFTYYYFVERKNIYWAQLAACLSVKIWITFTWQQIQSLTLYV